MLIGESTQAKSRLDGDDADEMSPPQVFARLMDDYDVIATIDRMWQCSRNFRDLSMMVHGTLLSAEDPKTVEELREIHYQILLAWEDSVDGIDG
tara:strand:- start:405 stop:686 length:282 start_codon:yes stop_codon:yes gene_type:complete